MKSQEKRKKRQEEEYTVEGLEGAGTDAKLAVARSLYSVDPRCIGMVLINLKEG